MHDVRDAEDRRLLEEGEHKLLLAAYFHPVRERCYLRFRSDDMADEATQRVFLRLLSELHAGKTYAVPFRVVVWMVTEWTLRSYYPGAKQDSSLPEGWDPEAPGAYAEWEDDYDVGALSADLSARQCEVINLRYREQMTPGQIAERLKISRNAVDQALHNAHKNLAEKLRG